MQIKSCIELGKFWPYKERKILYHDLRELGRQRNIRARALLPKLKKNVPKMDGKTKKKFKI